MIWAFERGTDVEARYYETRLESRVFEVLSHDIKTQPHFQP